MFGTDKDSFVWQFFPWTMNTFTWIQRHAMIHYYSVYEKQIQNDIQFLLHWLYILSILEQYSWAIFMLTVIILQPNMSNWYLRGFPLHLLNRRLVAHILVMGFSCEMVVTVLPELQNWDGIWLEWNDRNNGIFDNMLENHNLNPSSTSVFHCFQLHLMSSRKELLHPSAVNSASPLSSLSLAAFARYSTGLGFRLCTGTMVPNLGPA